MCIASIIRGQESATQAQRHRVGPVHKATARFLRSFRPPSDPSVSASRTRPRGGSSTARPPQRRRQSSRSVGIGVRSSTVAWVARASPGSCRLWMFTFKWVSVWVVPFAPGGPATTTVAATASRSRPGEQCNYGFLTREAGRRSKRSRRCSATRGRTPHSSSREDHQPDHVRHDPRLAPAPKT